jgi:hypothetical protein
MLEVFICVILAVCVDFLVLIGGFIWVIDSKLPDNWQITIMFFLGLAMAIMPWPFILRSLFLLY